MIIPTTIQVGYKTYTASLEEVPLHPAYNDFNYGRVEHVQGEIVVNSSVPEEEQVNTIIHELLHCFEHVYRIEFGSDEQHSHANIDRLSSALTALLLDNPELLESIKNVS